MNTPQLNVKYHVLAVGWAAVAAVFSVWCSLLALQPHPTRLQEGTSRQITPEEQTSAAGSVQITRAATPVPKSASDQCCTVSWWPRVVINVERGELPTVVLEAERIEAGVTREPAYQQQVVVCLGQYYERAVLGVVPVAGVMWLQVELQLVAVVGCQLTELIVAEPVVAASLTKSHFVLRPRTIKVTSPVVLLDQQWVAVGCNTVINLPWTKRPISLQSHSQSAY